MSKEKKRRGFLTTFRNYFIAGIVVLIPIGITVYLTLLIVKISSNIIPKEINPNHYLPYDIPGLEILISIILAIFEVGHWPGMIYLLITPLIFLAFYLRDKIFPNI